MRWSAIVQAVDRYFGIRASGSRPLVEARAGITTFLTMAYILFVNPAILGQAIRIDGVDVHGQLLTTTAIATAVGTLVMALWARYPFAVAPGMGINAYFAYSVVLGLGIPWRTALGVIFLSGVLFLILSVVGARELVVNAIPQAIKTATSAGIGLFLAVIGMHNAGLIRAHPVTLVTLGRLGTPEALLALLGLVLVTGLLVLRVRGAMLIGIGAVTILAVVSGAPVYEGKPFAGLAGGLLQPPAWPVDLFLQMDVRAALQLGLAAIVFVFLFVDLFDTAGTLVGLSETSGFAPVGGRLERAGPAFTADAIATTTGAMLGTSSMTAYIESAAGIEDGGRTGLTALVVALLFLLSIFVSPLAAAVPTAATAPVLIVIGAMMMQAVVRIDWTDYTIAVPAFLTIVTMPLTYSIANGISAGIVSYSAICLITGRLKKLHWLMVVLAVLLVARYAYLSEV